MSGTIFISYRRGDDPGSAGRLFERLLAEGFSADQLFMDIDSIAPGVDFVNELRQQVDRSDVMLAVIGKGWIDARDSTGARRLDSPEDFVRIEIEAALKQNKRVIPVLMQDAQMPRAENLPEAIRPLAFRNAVRLTHERFRLDTQSLVKALQQALDDAATARERQLEIARRNVEEKERQRALDEAERRAQAEREAADRSRLEQEETRRRAIAGLSAEQIAKAEELANWDFIKQSARADDFRDHLARFPGGVCERMARHRLSELEWSTLGSERRKEALESYLKAYPDSPHGEHAKRELAALDRQEADRAQAQSARAAALNEEAQGSLDGAKREGESSQMQPMPARLEPKPARKLPLWGKAVLGGLALVFAGALLVTLRPNTPSHVSTPPKVEQPHPTPQPLPQPKAQPQPQPKPQPSEAKPAPASICPSISQGGFFELTLNAGFKPYQRRISAGGSFDLSQCRSSAMTGWTQARPDVVLTYEAAGGRTLTVEVQSSTDTVLAINDPGGVWHFNDDGAGNSNPRIRFPKAARGRYDIFVGTYSSSAKGAAADLVITDR